MIKISSVARFVLPAVLAGGAATASEAPGHGEPIHPRLFVRPGDLEAMREKVTAHSWAERSFVLLRERVDPVAEQVARDPDWLTSRLMMNWETHYTLPVVRNAEWIGGEGRAPVPTPRFAGARDWKVNYRMPTKLEDWKPYNSRGDEIWLQRTDREGGEWVHAGRSGRVIESANNRILRIAAEAGFLYWMTGEERYAKVAFPVLWTYMEGFSHVLPPRFEGPDDERIRRIIGTTSFEVIHEDPLVYLSQCYDFVYHYLVRQGKDPHLVQSGFKRMIERIVEGGFAEGNWNLFQARKIAFGGLVLEPNEHYEDGRGREYYVELVLNADLPRQLGVMEVMKRGYDPITALWPEAPAYGFETTDMIVEIMSLLSGDVRWRRVLSHPLLERAMLAQFELLHPNGLSVGLGDTTNVRIKTRALELLIAAARERRQESVERKLTTMLRRELDERRYSRTRLPDVQALTRFVGELAEGPEFPETRSRCFYGHPLNVLMMNLPAESPDSNLSAALFGTAGEHMHANGLAIELYGAGRILGADPGRGSSYWQADHRHYYSRPAAHNTVIPNGNLSYSPNRPKQIMMVPNLMEPGPGEDALSPNLGFARATFHYRKPGVQQRRLLALVRTGEASGFYFDVFRSRFEDPEKEKHHDYLYHGMGQGVELSPGEGELALAASDLLGEEHGDMRGYGYFRKERSVATNETFRARFELEMKNRPTPVMDLWMPDARDRRVFALEAPSNRAIRERLPGEVRGLPMPTVLVRRKGEAWERPFVAIYEPFFRKEGPEILRVRPARSKNPEVGLAAAVVEGRSSRVLLMEAARTNAHHEVEGVEFEGEFGVVRGSAGQVDELYLGRGWLLGFKGLRVRAKVADPVTASLRRHADGTWSCEVLGEAVVETPDGGSLELPEMFR